LPRESTLPLIKLKENSNNPSTSLRSSAMATLSRLI
jgi:hypothetical protein